MLIAIITFFLTILIIELYYKIFVLRKDMKYNPNKVPSEVLLLIKKYQIDMKKVNYYYLMKSIGRINALSVALIVFIVTFFKKMNIQLLMAMLICIPVILLAYTLFGRELVKQGLSTDKELTKKIKKKTKNKKQENKKGRKI